MNLPRGLCGLAALAMAASAASGAGAGTPAIVVDQFGYLPDQPKVAVLREPVKGFDAGQRYSPGGTIELVDLATGKPVLTGAATAWNQGAVDPSSGDRAWWFDFSKIVRPGRYRVVDPANNVRSAPFSIGERVYRQVLVQAVRMLFYQRAGFPKEARFAGARWADGPSHQGPLQDRHARLYSAPGDAATERDLHGGWFDAGDFNRYTSWAAQNIVVLLDAYRERPAIWTDDTNIPESGDGIPDLLNEVDWELGWLERMQLPDGSLLFETASDTGSPPSSAKGQSLYGPPNSHATSAGAAAYAVAALVYRTIPAWRGRAAGLTERAERAWAWVSAHPRVTFTDASADHGRVRLAADAIETDDAGRAATMLAAAAYLFELTGKPAYRFYVDAHLADLGKNQFFAIDALVHYAGLKGATPASVAAIKRLLTEQAAPFLAPQRLAADDPYRAFIPGYWWGSNRLKAQTGLLVADLAALDPADASAIDAVASGYIHYIHGVNPLGKVYLSNMGAFGATDSVDSFFHSWFAEGTKWESVSRSPAGPPPGYLVGGPDEDYRWDPRCPAINPKCGSAMPSPPAGQPPQKSYKDFATAWPLDSWQVTEPDLLYQTAYIRLLSRFVR
ncbi:MAG TPA: glycoside hydrolase family 9 protein [Allosphingosinicella sp.]|nr:glycoside hydrolase family 9 protein [Allosphingosinicella sp.]